MVKSFWYMMFMVVLLPSVGLTSLKTVWLIVFPVPGQNSTAEFNWNCIFLPDSGSFFVNYATTAALAGAGESNLS